jgi:hypothetical protein
MDFRKVYFRIICLKKLKSLMKSSDNTNAVFYAVPGWQPIRSKFIENLYFSVDSNQCIE